ncbi:MAG: hypothetical protein EAZ36_01600 [Verrucomicrobia bacterium]|nr:MAG: hypothetical protein EAZ36_01600 [Verrucomicrobiota bacterium]
MLTRSLSSFPSRRRRGIALLVTVTLLVFLVLIAVALSSLVRVETQIAVNTDAVAQARQNALFGMNMALGRLQETAGPDRRITARADILGGTPNNAYLTGVWDETGALITWLVNGNEDHASGSPEIEPGSPVSRILNPTSKPQNPITNPLFDDQNPAATSAAANPRFGPGHVYLVSGRIDGGENAGSVDVRTDAGYKDAVGERIILRKTPIRVPGTSLPGKDGSPGVDFPVGHYAYWVADDGIKASIGSGNRSNTLDYNDSGTDGTNFSSTQQDATDESFLAKKFLNGIQLQATRTDLVLRDNAANEIFAPSGRLNFYGVLPHPETAGFLEGLASTRQVNSAILATDFSAPATVPQVPNIPTTTAALDLYKNDVRDRLRQRFHDITPKSRAVLTNMIDGGLRQDLSQLGGPATLGANLALGVTQLVDFWRPSVNRSSALDATSAEGNLARTAIIIPAPESAFALTGAPADTGYYPVTPVITEFEFRTVFSIDGSGQLQVTFTSAVELWNPYNVELTIPNGESIYVSIPILRDSGDPYLSDITLVNNGVSAAISLERTISRAGSPTPGQEVFIIFQLTTTGAETWQPGEAKVWQLDQIPDRPALTAAGAVVTGMIAGELPTVQVDASELNITLHQGNAPFTVPDTDTVFTPPKIFAIRGLPYAPGGSAPDGVVTYYVRMKDQVDFEANNEHWLEQMEPRGPVHTFSSTTPMFVMNDPVTAFQSERILFDSANQLLRNDQSGTPSFVTLFDVPRQDLTSIGALQHLAFTPSSGGGATSTPSYRLGAKDSNTVNNVFETHFFSTVPRGNFGATGWSPKRGDLLANTSLRIFDPSPNTPLTDAGWLNRSRPDGSPTGLQTERAAEYLLIEDAFNINSTSVAAWMGVLGGALPALADPAANALADRADYVWDLPIAPGEMKANWRYRDQNGNAATQAVSNVFFRLPHTAPDLRADYVTTRDNLGDSTDQTRHEAAFRLGLREFTKAEIETLATGLVNAIRARGRPFLTLTEFIDSGLLQDAIDVSGLNTKNNFDIPKRSTAYLMQGDILQLIAPRLVARSDTFTIRAYGDVADTTDVTGATIKARAWLEATVQRIPTKHSTANDPADSMTPTQETAGNFGRQFKVVSMRWLDPDEI